MPDARRHPESTPPRVLAIWLDGFSFELADRFELPFLGSLASRSAVATIDSNGDQLTGLTGEHLATGLDPGAGGRASAVRFDPTTYGCTQLGTAVPPVYGGVPTTVLDPCYFDLDLADPLVGGLVDWGAHDPGTWSSSRPDDLRREAERRFGRYPATRWTYATPWASADDTTEMGRGLVEGVRRRTRLAQWLLTERLPDWRLGLVGVAEAHSASEGLFHGVDPSPRWSGCASRPAAATALASVYLAIDDLVASLVEAIPDALHVVFSMHGMGPNTSDIPSMVLLGELMRRWHGDPTPECAFPLDEHGLPRLDPDDSWIRAVRDALGEQEARTPSPVRRVARRLGWRHATRRSQGAREASVGWIPLMRHQPHWPEMRAFALPSYYDGRVRVNVVGREAHGLVDPSDYGSTLDEIQELLEACTDPVTGAPVVDSVHRPSGTPHEVGEDDADLVVAWRPDVAGVSHPSLGTIGPIPPRRTGGHTSSIGRMLVSGAGVEPMSLGTRPSADVVPTLLELSDSRPSRRLAGLSIEVPLTGV